MFSLVLNSVRFKLLDGKITAAISHLTGCCESILPHLTYLPIVLPAISSKKLENDAQSIVIATTLSSDGLEDHRGSYNPLLSPQLRREWISPSIEPKGCFLLVRHLVLIFRNWLIVACTIQKTQRYMRCVP
jgi:hypothetical protein